jgi:hypothetical protein
MSKCDADLLRILALVEHQRTEIERLTGETVRLRALLGTPKEVVVADGGAATSFPIDFKPPPQPPSS